MLKKIIKKNSGLDLVIRKELPGMAADLGLKVIPDIDRYEYLPGVVADVHCQVFASWKEVNIRGRDYASLIVQSTKPIYKINVDMGKLYARQVEIYRRFGAYAAYDYTAVVIMHELRHIWQAQENVFCGEASDCRHWLAEMDAYQYPVDVCTGRRRLIAYRELLIDRNKVDTKAFCMLEERIFRAYKGGAQHA